MLQRGQRGANEVKAMISRPHGVVGSAAGLVPFGHLGWGYRDRRDFLRRAAEYLTDGLRERQFAVYVGSGTVQSLTAELTHVRQSMGEDTAGSPIEVIPARQFYAYVPNTDVVDPEASVAARVAATERAIAEGYTGFRAVVDATCVARTKPQREAFRRFEFLIDEQMSRFPVSALCAYDTTELGDAAELVCLHPYVNAECVSYQIFATPDADVAVTGAVDAHRAADFIGALFTACGAGRRTSVTVDASGADYLAADCMRRLDQAARRDDRPITLLVRSPSLVAFNDRLSHVRIAYRAAPVADPAAVTALRAEISQLQNRLASQPVIEQCKGMLMAAFGLTAGDAFELLKSVSQQGNLKLREVARGIVDQWPAVGPRPDYDTAAEFLRRIRETLTSGPG
jgi:hypothetical protein